MGSVDKLACPSTQCRRHDVLLGGTHSARTYKTTAATLRRAARRETRCAVASASSAGTQATSTSRDGMTVSVHTKQRDRW